METDFDSASYRIYIFVQFREFIKYIQITENESWDFRIKKKIALKGDWALLLILMTKRDKK